MNCEEVRRRMIDRTLEELPAEEIHSLEEHIRSCAACAQVWEEVTATHALLARNMVQADPPRHFRIVPADVQVTTNWWERLWVPVLRLGLSAGLALFLLAGSLALFGASLTRQNGELRVAFGRESTPTQTAGVPSAQIEQAVQASVGEAERRLAQKQKEELARLGARLELASAHQVRRLGQRLELLQTAQNQIWKETQHNNYLVQLVARGTTAQPPTLKQ